MNAGIVSSPSCAAALLCLSSPALFAQPAPPPAPEQPPKTDARAGELADDAEAQAPPDSAVDLLDREHLTGGWGGARSSLAAAGLTLDIGWTQFAQGVVDGGRRRDWDYGGNLDMMLNADLDRAGVVPGGTLWARAESRYGETINDDSGAFTPVNTRGYFPLTDRMNEGIPFTITELAYTQSIDGTLDFTVGKMLTAEGDPNEFAGGLGRTQFLNSNFIYNAATSQTSPYSTLGVALDWYAAPWITVSSAVFSTTDSSTTTGFDHLDDGWTWWTQAETRYRLGPLPGGMNVGFQYAFDSQFTKIGGRLTLIPGGVSLDTVSDSWAAFWGVWQYLCTPDSPPDEIDASDARADIRGVGLFARIGFADPDANPVNWSASMGLGGRGMIPGRDEDAFGVGYYYTDVQDSAAFSLLGLPSSSQGVEAFYNIALTPAVGLTVDVQWVDEGVTDTEAATVLGVRLDMNF
jgi:porin